MILHSSLQAEYKSRVLALKRHPIPSLGGELWGIFVGIWDKIYRVITTLHCLKLLHMRFYMQCLPTFAKQWIVYLYWIAHFRPISHNNTNTCTVIMWCNHCIMTSCNGNNFCITRPLREEFTGHRWIPHKKPVTRSFGAFFDLRLNKRLSKQSWGWWFEMP